MPHSKLSGPFVDKSILQAIAPVIKNKEAWDAFIAILDYEESKLCHKLRGEPTTDQLHRLAGASNLLHALRSLRDNMLAAEKEFLNGE